VDYELLPVIVPAAPIPWRLVSVPGTHVQPSACIRLERTLQAGTQASASLVPGNWGQDSCSNNSCLQVRTPALSFLQGKQQSVVLVIRSFCLHRLATRSCLPQHMY
jgi:hypothetical protein